MIHFIVRWLLVIFAVAALTSCAPPDPADRSGNPPSNGTDCGGPSDCPRGTYCDGVSRRCTYDCAADDDCADGFACSSSGRCRASVPSTDASVATPDGPTSGAAIDALQEPLPFVEGSAEGARRNQPGGGDGITFSRCVAWAPPVMPLRVVGYRHRDTVSSGVLHSGVDIEAAVGTPVHAVCTGEIRFAAGVANGWGGLVEESCITPAGEWVFVVIGHCDPASIRVRAGDHVEVGATLCLSGSTANNGGWSPHTHWAIVRPPHPASGVFKGHVPMTEFFPQYDVDPVAFLEERTRIPGCDAVTSTCVPAAPCTSGISECRVGTTRCEAGETICEATSFRPRGTACSGGGTCDGAGLCVPVPVDPCRDVPCDHGRCDHGRCVCPFGWQGERCERPTCVRSAEVCDGADNDCDGLVDEGLGTSSCGAGVCQRSVANCVGGRSQACVAGRPGTETCNGLDDDCDGVADDGVTRPCTTACGTGVETCADGSWRSCSAPLSCPASCVAPDVRTPALYSHTDQGGRINSHGSSLG